MIAEIKGTEHPEQIISFGAHYDSVEFSKGVYDNGAGSVINMEAARWFAQHPPKRTVKFCWYGSEEIGLEGSKAFVRDHKDELKDHVFMINVDVRRSSAITRRLSQARNPSYTTPITCSKSTASPL